MGWMYYNANPSQKWIDDASTRALSLAFGVPYRSVLKLQRTYVSGTEAERRNVENIMEIANHFCDLDKMALHIMNSDDAPMTVNSFCNDTAEGTYLLFAKSNDSETVVAVVDGHYYNTDCVGRHVVTAILAVPSEKLLSIAEVDKAETSVIAALEDYASIRLSNLYPSLKTTIRVSTHTNAFAKKFYADIEVNGGQGRSAILHVSVNPTMRLDDIVKYETQRLKDEVRERAYQTKIEFGVH